jgi:hypothetical protein
MIEEDGLEDEEDGLEAEEAFPLFGLLFQFAGDQLADGRIGENMANTGNTGFC